MWLGLVVPVREHHYIVLAAKERFRNILPRVMAYHHQMNVSSISSRPRSSVAGPAKPQAPNTPEEQKVLDAWVKRYQPELGLLQSPPTGPVAPKAKEAQRYVSALIQELAGPRLRESGIDLRVEIFSGDIAQIGLDDSVAQEAAWEKENPNSPWPVRTWLEAPKDGSKPLYRLAVSQGLLETLGEREELGFVVAHQLQKLLTHHAEDPENKLELRVQGQSWLKSRQFQLQNDAAALEMMTGANLNPKGALGALEKLYKKFGPSYPADNQKAALVAASEVQEHEGVRFSALQLQVENLRRKGHPATATPTHPIPRDIVASAGGDYGKKLEDFNAFESAVKVASVALATEETPAWMFGGRSENSAVALLKSLQPNAEEFEKALLGACEHLSEKVESPQHRVNGLLRLALALDGDSFPQGLSSAGQQKLRDFFTANSAWSADRFLASLSRDGQSLHREFATEVSLNPEFQSTLAPLYADNKEVQSLVNQTATTFCRNPETGAFDIQALPLFFSLNNDENRQGAALGGVHNQAGLGVLRAQDPEQLAREIDPSGLSRGLLLGNELRRVDNLSPELALSLRETLRPIQQAANAVREDAAALRLRPPLAEPEKLGFYLQELFASELGGDFTPGFETKLKPMLLDLVRSFNQQPDLVFDSGRPRELEPGLQKRLVALMEEASPQDKNQVVRHLARTWSHELRLPAQSERRAWTHQVADYLKDLSHSELVATLSAQDIGQHSQFLTRTLRDGYLLTPEALPGADTESLQNLADRVAAGEFIPKRENYQSSDEYAKAREAYDARMAGMQKVTRFLAPVEARPLLSKLSILGHQPEAGKEVADRLSSEEFLGILKNTEETVERSKLLRRLTNDPGLEVIGTDAASFLIDGFLATEKSFKDIQTFYEVAKRTIQLNPVAVEARAGTRNRIADALNARLGGLEAKELREWLGKDLVLNTLKPDQASTLLYSLVSDLAVPGSSPEELGKAIRELENTFELKDKHGLAYMMLRDSVTENAKLQPNTLNTVFPPDESNPVERLRQFRPQLAGLSGLVAMTRNQPALVQLATIEYIMGRTAEMPEFLEAATDNQKLGPLTQSIRNAREALADADIAARVVVANSFLTGPTGLMRVPGGKDALLEHFLAGVRPKALKIARPISQALLASQGDADSLTVAVVLGQRAKKEGQALTEADIMSRVFDSYGVPGIKLKQYLAFTSQFESYREAFESSQDAANPLNYFETLRLIQSRFGDEWPDDLEIDKLLGSGSVNVAVRYKDKTTGKREVVALGREDIKEQTDYDFARFRKFVDELTSTPEGAASFGFIKGLIGIIAESVSLEFDKEAALAVQKQAFETYKHKFDDGWTVRSIDAHSAKNMGLFMEEARGKSARKVLSSDPDLYDLAVGHVAEAEFNLLKGRDASSNILPRPNFANPDIHDGQMLIDEESKTVTVLDFGQAVPISNKERELGLDLLTVLGKLRSGKNAAKLLNKRFFSDSPKGGTITKEEVQELFKPGELANVAPKTMDVFIRLLALVSEKGGKVPLSTVHWVLAMNRQLVLGEKVGQPIKAQLVGMAINSRLGLGLGAFNAAQASLERVGQWTSSLVGGVAGFVSGVAGTVEGFFGGWFGKEQPEPEEKPGAIKLQSFRGFDPALLKELKAPEKKTHRAWRDESSFAFYIDDFGDEPEESLSATS